VKARSKFLVGGALILSTAGYLMASSIEETATYYLTPQELATKIAADPSFHETGVKVGARVVSGSIQRDAGGRSLSFQMTDGAKTFTDDVDVVVEGRLGEDGTFRATTLLAKCASRYENAPGQEGGGYQNTPGYKAAKGPQA